MFVRVSACIAAVDHEGRGSCGGMLSACEQDGHVDVARSEFELALVLRSQGGLVQAQALLTAVVCKEAVAFGERHLCVARSEHELAMVLRKKGSLDEARALLPAVVQKKVAALGDKHLDVARSQVRHWQSGENKDTRDKKK